MLTHKGPFGKRAPRSKPMMTELSQYIPSVILLINTHKRIPYGGKLDARDIRNRIESLQADPQDDGDRKSRVMSCSSERFIALRLGRRGIPETRL